MKRALCLILSVISIYAMALPVLAEGEDGSYRTSRYSASASYRDWQDIFTECEIAGPDCTLTRALLFAGLYHLSGAEITVTEAPFFDVDPAAWYAAAAQWSRNSGLFMYADDGSGYFYPDGEIDREGLCLILKGFVSCMGWSVPDMNEWFPFYDGGLFFTAPGRDAAAMMQRGGILIEETDGCFYPHELVTVREWESVALRLISVCCSGISPFPALPLSTVKESDPVEDRWFDDVCFIGHSQVVGMEKYFHLDNADYFAVIGHTAKAVVEYEDYILPQGGMGSLRRGLEGNSYGKVYVMLGINDCSDREDRIAEFMEPMHTILDLVKETQPDAVIYMISVLPVGDYNPNPYIYNLENVTLYSQAVKALSREYGAEYIDLFRLMAAPDGSLLSSYDAGDGIHIQAPMYDHIKNYLKTHTGGH